MGKLCEASIEDSSRIVPPASHFDSAMVGMSWEVLSIVDASEDVSEENGREV